MAFLRKKDYYIVSDSSDLDVVTGSDDALLAKQELAGIEELSSFLRHRYEVDHIFKNILAYSTLTMFKAGDLVEWSEEAYDPAATYNTDDRASYAGGIYEADEDGITGDFDSTKWTEMADNEALYVCKVPNIGNLPSEAFAYTSNLFTRAHDEITGWDREDYATLYFKRDGDYVKIYTTEADRDAGADYVGIFEYVYKALSTPVRIDVYEGDNADIGLGGYIDIIGFADDGQEWDVTASNYWEEGDNRNQKIVQMLADINLYHLYARVQPRNIPEYIIQRYDGGTERQTAGVVGYLKMASKGEIDLNLPIHNKAERGQRIVFGGKAKLNNDY